MKTTYVDYPEYLDLNFRNPCRYYILNALQQRVYIHCKTRGEAKEWVDNEYNGRYTVQCAIPERPSGTETAFGKINSKSRAGLRKPK